MKMILLIVIVVVVFSSFGLWMIAYGNTTSEEENMNYGISMTTDKMNYSLGEPIMMKLKVFSYTEEEVTFLFNTGQRYDFIIEDEKGSEIWRWSEARMFVQMLGEEILGATNTKIIYTAEYTNKLRPGYYKITGVFIAQDRPMSGSIIIEVK